MGLLVGARMAFLAGLGLAMMATSAVVAADDPLPLPVAVAAPPVAATTLPVLIPHDVLADYQAWIAGRDPLLVRDFSAPGARRDVVELVLVQQALAAGGERRALRFDQAPSYQRILAELKAGNSLLLGTTAWRADLAALGPEVAISAALVPEGGSLAGLYTVPGNTRALAARTLADVRRLRVVSNQAWTADWEVLARLAPAELTSTPSWEAMVRVVAAGKADLLLAPFQGGDLSLTVSAGSGDDVPPLRLVPLPGLAVALPGSRHLATSLRHPLGAEVAAALDRGLARLAAAGTIERAYREAGFINAKVVDWTRIP